MTKKNNEENEDISFDLSKIFGFLKKSKKKSNTEHQNKEDISFNFDSAQFYLKKYSIVLLLIIPIVLSVFFRMYPATLPTADDWARNNVEGFYRNTISSQVNQQFPNLPETNRNSLIASEFEKFKETNSQMMEQQIAANSIELKSKFKDENGNTYLLAIDPWTYYRQTRNIVENGEFYDELKDGKPWNNHMLAPIGRAAGERPNLHVTIQYYMYKIVSFFNKDVDLLAVIFFSPILFSMLSVIPTFFITRKVAGNFGGFFAACILAIHPAFLSRTPGGFSDTDAYNVFFPLMITWLFIEAFQTKKLSKSIILSSLSGLMIGIYGMIWEIWFTYDLLVGAIALFIVYKAIMIKKPKKIFTNKVVKATLIVLGVFLITSQIFAFAFSGKNIAKQGLETPLNVMLNLKTSSKENYWPNVYTTVAELNEASFQTIINNIGFGSETAKMYFFFSLLGIVFSLFIRNKENNIDLKIPILLTLWFLGTTYSATKGIRFLLLFVPAFSIALGIFVGISYRYLVKWCTHNLEINKHISRVTMTIVVLLLLVAPLRAAETTARGEIPSMNDAWYDSLVGIKENSKPDAIINSWWDFGHWFKAIADRPVTFDGASQNTPMAHWIGKSLLTDDEDLAIGILRMLDCGSNNAFEYINANVTNENTIESVDLVNEIVVMEKDEVRIYLTENYSLPDSKINKILEMTHCAPPENFYITSEDMVGKSGVWSHFGSWDFRRASMWINVNGKSLEEGKQFIMDNFGYDDDEAIKLYYEIQNLDSGRSSNDWIAPWPSYMSPMSPCRFANEEMIQCDNGVVINNTNSEIILPTREGIKRPTSIGFINETNDFEVKVNEGIDVIPVSMILIPSGDTLYSILMDPALTGSMFTRLFYLQGHGLKHFDHFSEKRSIVGQNIIVWKVDWDGTDANVAYELVTEDLPETDELIQEVLDFNESNETTEKIGEFEQTGNES